MAAQIRITRAVARVLQEFLTDDRPRYGYDLMQATGYPSGKLYPILALLVDAGWLGRKQEDADRERAGRPARYLYTLTEQGGLAIQRELVAISEQFARPARARSAPERRYSVPDSGRRSGSARDRARR